MEELNFKKSFEDSLFTYLHVNAHAYASEAAFDFGSTNSPAEKLIKKEVSNEIFYRYLALSEYCSTGLRKFCLVQESPMTNNLLSQPIVRLNHSYLLLADDINGLGIDKGFVESESAQTALYPVSNFLQMHLLASSGSRFGGCSLFAINQRRGTSFVEAIQSEQLDLIDLLAERDCFIQIIIAEEIGEYNALLIKSPSPRDQALQSFFHVIDPNN